MSQSNPIEIQKNLAGVDYPVSKQQLIDKARDNGAGDDVLELLEKLPDRQYDGPNAVSAEVSKA
ncbi:DUF2795 domain-containing protein [Lentzea flava]|uniref:DUF2795 domain-containing protein n=1 Tax=Lentzea flava TaxID=103732 RepID=A0ABQ2UI43_9PSEU|nr:DUF2795 domain-containing protein [Lentzea flava]MCP2198210.1 Protein of unknown function (DUF2795) [Lentzea flava]GGU30962.1 hypothetical protein GCM10010178_24000 [Lentzea flava]